MNTDTGHLYDLTTVKGEQDAIAALKRGEHVVAVPDEALKRLKDELAKLDEEGKVD